MADGPVRVGVGGKRATRVRKPSTAPLASSAAKASAKEIGDTFAKYLGMGTLIYAAYISAPLDLTDEQTEALAMADDEAKAIAQPFGRILARTLPAAIARGFVNSDDWLEAGVALWQYGHRIAPTARQAAAVRASTRTATMARPPRQRRGRNADQPAGPPPAHESNGYGAGPVAGTAAGYGLGVQHNPDL